MSKRARRLLVAGVLLLALVLGFQSMARMAQEAEARQVNLDIDMERVADGTYRGSSDGGLVKAEAEVTVAGHRITDIRLLRHDNGRGKPAEAMLSAMVAANTDDVDGVAGATLSSRTIRNAVNLALRQGMQNENQTEVIQ